MNKSWIQAWKQGAFGVGGTCVYFQRMIFQGASNESGGSVCRAIKIRSKTDHRGLMVNKELFDSRLWTIRAVIAIGRRFAWAASAGNCPRIRVGWRRNGKREREKSRRLLDDWKRIGRLDDGREPTDPSRPFGGMFRGQSARAECLLPIGRAEPSPAPTVRACAAFV